MNCIYKGIYKKRKTVLFMKDIIKSKPPVWHFRMLNDEKRNNAYYRALQKHINSNSVVIDLGAGCGLLSLLSARLGAKHVFAIESNSTLCKSLKYQATQNGLDKKITIINKHSSNVKFSEDEIFQKASIIVTETFDGSLIGEDCLNSIDDIKKRFLLEDGIILPQKGKIKCAPIMSEQLKDEYFLEKKILDFDLSHFNNSCTISEDRVRIKFYDHTYLSKPISLLQIDFNKSFKKNINEVISFKIDHPSRIDGILIWFEIFLDKEVLENNYSSSLHWGQWLLIPPKTIKVKNKSILNLTIDNKKGYLCGKQWKVIDN